jgi:hypothetical protein
MRDFVTAYYGELPARAMDAWAKLDTHYQEKTGLLPIILELDTGFVGFVDKQVDESFQTAAHKTRVLHYLFACAPAPALEYWWLPHRTVWPDPLT